MTEMKEKIYPELPTIREQPTAPNVVNGGEDDRGHSYRLNVIRDIQKFFEEEIKQREAFSKKYFRIANYNRSRRSRCRIACYWSRSTLCVSFRN